MVGFMKRFLMLILCMAIVLMSFPTFAYDEQEPYIFFNGSRVELQIHPEFVNGICMVPLVELSEKTHILRGRVFMDPYTYSYSGILSYGRSFTAFSAGTTEAFNTSLGPIKLDAAPYVNREDLMVPLTLFNILSDQGVYVGYDYNENRIEIMTASMLGQLNY